MGTDSCGYCNREQLEKPLFDKASTACPDFVRCEE